MKILFTNLYDARFGMGGVEQVVFDLAGVMKNRFSEDVPCIRGPELNPILRSAGKQDRDYFKCYGPASRGRGRDRENKAAISGKTGTAHGSLHRPARKTKGPCFSD